MVFQLGALFDSLSVFGNVSYPIREHGERDEARIRKRVHEVLEMVELNGRGREASIPPSCRAG